jgi:hypothetical protein
MADAPLPLSPEQMTRFQEGMKEPYKEHEQEKRRGLEINVGFFEKLSALNAGSIALAASIILAIEARSNAVRTVLHQILIVVALLGASLLLGILHNFLAAVVAKLEAAYSETHLVVALTKLLLSSGRETVPIDDAAASQAASQVEDAVRSGLLPKQRRLAKAAQILYPAATVIGYLSTASFFAAYTLVMIYLLRLCRSPRNGHERHHQAIDR